MRKHRPSLTNEQITHILKLLSGESPLSLESIELVGILKPYLTKSLPLKRSLLSELLSEQNDTSSLSEAEMLSSNHIIPSNYASKEDYWHACYLRSLEYPSSLSKAELDAVLEHKYLNGLLSPSELIEFEAAAFGL